MASVVLLSNNGGGGGGEVLFLVLQICQYICACFSSCRMAAAVFLSFYQTTGGGGGGGGVLFLVLQIGQHKCMCVLLSENQVYQ